jgi:hypothetical protein
MMFWRLLASGLIIMFILSSCATPRHCDDGDQAVEGHAATDADAIPVPSNFRWPHGDARDFVQWALYGIHEYSFGERTWQGAGRRQHSRQYDVIRREARRPLPVVVSDRDFSPQHIPDTYPDSIVPVYGREGLKQYLTAHGIEDDILVMWIGLWEEPRNPQTYVRFRLRSARLTDSPPSHSTQDDGLYMHGDFNVLAGWVHRWKVGSEFKVWIHIESVIAY